MNMAKWVADTIASPAKKGFPVLSFPAIQKMDVAVKDLIGSADLQAEAMRLVAESTPSAASVSFMDLSLIHICICPSRWSVARRRLPSLSTALAKTVHDARTSRTVRTRRRGGGPDGVRQVRPCAGACLPAGRGSGERGFHAGVPRNGHRQGQGARAGAPRACLLYTSRCV